MKKISLLLVVLCAQVTYVMHADQNGQSLSLNEPQNLLLHESPEIQPGALRDEESSQDQSLDKPEPRKVQAVAPVQQELDGKQPKDDKEVAQQEQITHGSVDKSQKVSTQSDTQPAVQEELVVSCSKTVASYSLLQVGALTVGGAITGYGCYQGCKLLFDWYSEQKQGNDQPMTLSAKDRDLLFNFADAMGQDVKQARTAGKRKASLVQKFDISGLSMPLLIECNYIQSDFVKLYHQCDEEGNGIELLNLFYCEFNDALKELVEQAQII